MPEHAIYDPSRVRSQLVKKQNNSQQDKKITPSPPKRESPPTSSEDSNNNITPPSKKLILNKVKTPKFIRRQSVPETLTRFVGDLMIFRLFDVSKVFYKSGFLLLLM